MAAGLDIYSLITHQAQLHPEATALLAPGRRPMTYAGLAAHVEKTVAALNAAGIGPGKRVAVVVPNGPEMAALCLALSACAASAPLNPAYRAAELEFYLSDLRPAALIVEQNLESPAAAVAQSLGIPAIRLFPGRNREAGFFSLDTGVSSAGHGAVFSRGHEVALMLHTSGTTARPKLVPLTGANLCHSAGSVRDSLQLTADDRCLNVMPLFHVHGLVAAVLASIAAGASVVCTPGFYATDFFDWWREFHPTWYTAVPTMHQAILARAGANEQIVAGSPLRLIRSCSAPLPPRLLEELEERFHAPVIEAYGMTEAAHQMASNPLPPGQRRPGSVGLPAGSQIAIMDDEGNLQGPEKVGEVVIRGPNVMGGYEANPQANHSSFTGGWFRTGDQGWMDSQGYLFLGSRIKELIIRGGEKIAPREVDEVLLEHPAVLQAVAFALPDPKLGEDVGAAVVLREPASPSEAELREFVAARLADFKVPRHIVFLPEIPKGPTGKIQRIGLAERLGLAGAATPPPPAAPAVAPRTSTESTLLQLWREVLAADGFGIHDNFFELGGDSMLAGLLTARLRAQFGVEFPVVRIFQTPTVAQMASYIDELSASPPALALPPLKKSGRDAVQRLSLAQERMWVLSQYEPDAAVNNRPLAVRLVGHLDVKALERSLSAIVARHEVLRTRYQEKDAGPVQLISAPEPFALPQLDLRALPSQERDTRLRQLALDEARRPFDLSRDLVLRALLVRSADQDSYLLLTVHHIAFDAWSAEVLLRELELHYNAYAVSATPHVPDLPLQYADFACWQRESLQGERLSRLVSYWEERLRGAPALHTLVTDNSRPARESHNGALQSLHLPKELAGRLHALSLEEGCTLFMTLLAAFQTLLYRYSGSTDIVVGAPVAARSHRELEPLIGCFFNILVLRTDLGSSPSFRQLLAQVRNTTLDAYAHQDLPFEKLLESIPVERTLRHAPLFQIMFQFRDVPRHAPRFQDLAVQEFEFDPGIAHYDLVFDLRERESGLSCVAEYNTDLFERESIRRMLDHYRVLLEGIVADPGCPIERLPLLGEGERQQVLVEWNQTRRPYPQASVVDLFEQQAARRPEAVAVVLGGERLSYGELNRRANQLAHYLRGQGVGPEVRVGQCVERSLEMVVGLLGILKAGGVYVPLDPTYPRQRLEFMLRDAAAPLLLSQGRWAAQLPVADWRLLCLDSDWGTISQHSDQPPRERPGLDDAAYVIYTSGSTGQPKGVVVPHRGLASFFAGILPLYGVEPSDRVLQFSSLTFDVSLEELFISLLSGATLVLWPGFAASVQDFLRFLDEQQITLLSLPTSYWHELVSELAESGLPASVRTVTIAGEAALPERVNAWLERFRGKVALINGYGPTETTILATTAKLESLQSAHVAIGRPLANTEVYLLDGLLQLVPVGVPGELYIGGAGLARGYLNRPDLTAERFLAHPYREGERLYRTGDRCRYRGDGTLEFLGREDAQVKLRGFRIELGEIEAVLRGRAGVKAVAVVLREDEPGEKQLVAYVVGEGVSREQLREQARQKLPEYMVPAHFVLLGQLPLLPNGKLDRQALLRGGAPSVAARSHLHPPRTALEKTIAEVWSELLNVPEVGAEDDFFDLGGHSLLALRLVSRLTRKLRVRISLQEVFDHPTVSELAELVSQREPGTGPPHG